MQLNTGAVGLALAAAGALTNLGFFVAYAGNGWDVFFFVLVALILAPWILLTATLRLRPLGPTATLLVTIVTCVMLVISSAVFIDARNSMHDAQGGVLFVVVPV